MLSFRGRRLFAATSLLLGCPGAILACCSPYPRLPDLFWHDLAFGLGIADRPAAPSDPFVSFAESFVSELIPGQIAAPPRPMFDVDADDLDTGFRSGMQSIATSAGFAPGIDPALIDVSGQSSRIDAGVQRTPEFVQTDEQDVWTFWVAAEIDEPPSATPTSTSTCIRFSPDAWKVAESWGDLAKASAYLVAARPTSETRKLVFEELRWGLDPMEASVFDRNEFVRTVENVEPLSPERPVVATLVVRNSPLRGCRGSSFGNEVVIDRFPIALLSNDP